MLVHDARISTNNKGKEGKERRGKLKKIEREKLERRCVYESTNIIRAYNMPVTAATGKERNKMHVQTHSSMPLKERRAKEGVSYRREEIELFMNEKNVCVCVCVCV